MFLTDIRHAKQLFSAVDSTGGIAGITQHDRPGLGIDQLFDFCVIRQGKAVLSMSCNGFQMDRRHGGKSVVVCIKRFGDDDLVTFIGHHHHGKGDGFASRCGHDDIFRGELDADPGVIMYQTFLIHFQSLRGTVCQHLV